MAVAPINFPGLQVSSGGADFSSLSQLPQIIQQRQAENVRRQTLATLGQGGQIDPMQLIQSGDMNLANLGIGVMNRQQEQARQAERDRIIDERDKRDFAQRQQYQNAQLGLSRRAAERADAEKFTPVKREHPDGTVTYGAFNPRTGETAWKDAGAPQQTAQAAVSPLNMPQNKNFKNALDKADAERVTEYTAGAKLAEEGKATVDQIEALRKSAFTAPLIGPAAAKLGHGATQALEASTNALALDVAQKMKGSLSDKDIAFVKSQVPTAATVGAAGDAAIGLIRSGFERTQQRALFFRAWAEQNGNINGADAAWKRYTDENSLTVDDKKALGGRRFNPDYNKDFSKYLVRPGIVQDGYRFKGGDPADPNSWVKLP